MNEKSKMAATYKQKSSFRYIITNKEHKNLLCLIHENGQNIIFRWNKYR